MTEYRETKKKRKRKKKSNKKDRIQGGRERKRG